MLSFISTTVQAATFIVTRTDDPAPNGCNSNIDCSLREAVIAANDSADLSSTITVPAGTYQLTRNGVDESGSLTGDLDIQKNITVNGVDARTAIIDAASLGDRIFDSTTGPLTLNNLTLQNGDASASLADSGGAIYVAGGNLTVNNCLFTDNTAEAGGAIFTPGARSITVTNSTFSQNEATGNQPVTGGGAIYIGVGGELFLSNSTVSGNTSVGFGGGINTTDGTIVIRSSTIAENSADQGGGIFLNANNGSLDIANSILAMNQAGSGTIDCSKNIPAIAISGGYNIFSSVNDCTIIVSTDDEDAVNDPGLLTLANYGGQTPTYLLEANSIAIDNGDPTGCDDASGNLLATDQRGQNREAGGRCDSGATELGISDLLVSKTQDTNVIASGGILIYTVTVTNNGPDNNFNVALTDDLPPEVTFNSVITDDSTDVCSQASGIVSCALGQINDGQSAVVTIAVTIDNIPLGGTITNTASVQGTETDPNPDNDSTSIDTTVGAEGGCSLRSGAQPNYFISGFLLVFAGLACCFKKFSS